VSRKYLDGYEFIRCTMNKTTMLINCPWSQ
jgi:hypothetical protein